MQYTNYTIQALLVIQGLVSISAAPVVPATNEAQSATVVVQLGQNNNIVGTDEVGGPHGDAWDDASVIGPDNLRIGMIEMWCDKANNGELQALGFGYRDNVKQNGWHAFRIHGTNATPLQFQSWELAKDEYITTINAWTYEARGRTRIGTLVFNTNKRAGLATCGPKTGIKVTLGNPEWALLYTSGRSGRIVDFLKAHWINEKNL